LLPSIETANVVGLRERALIGLMVYSFARIGAALGMTVEEITAYLKNSSTLEKAAVMANHTSTRTTQL
jgi:hypothetical protein